MNARSRYLTIRNVPPNVAAAIERERKGRGKTLNATVLDLLRVALGVGSDAEGPFDNGLAKHAGGWTKRDLEEFERNTLAFEQIDEELWQ